MSTNLPHNFQVRVYYEDTDLGQVVYHANYIKYFERARTEWLRSIGLDQQILIEQNLAFAVVTINNRYLKPARFNDLLDVKTDVKRFGRASMTFEQHIYLKNNSETLSCAVGTLLCCAEIKVACIKLDSFTSTALPEILIQQIHGVQ